MDDNPWGWEGKLTVEERVGIRTKEPSEKLALDVIGDIAATRVGIGTKDLSEKLALDVIGDIAATGDICAKDLNLSGSLTIDKKLDVSENIQLGGNLQFTTGLAISEFSDDGNLTDGNSSALPTEQAVKTYVDNQIKTRAALNGASDQDFTAQNLTVSGNVTGSLTVENDLTVGNAIATKQLSVTAQVTGSLTVENNLTVGNAIATKEVNATEKIQANRFEGDGSALTGISTGKWSDGSSGRIYYNVGNVGIGTTNPGAKLEISGSLKLQSGVAVNEFSSDTALGGNSNLAVPTEKAVKTYVENCLSGINPSQWSNGSSGRIYYNSGNVGIGTKYPTAKLEVNTSSGGAALKGTTSASGGYLRLYSGDFVTTSTGDQDKDFAYGVKGEVIGKGNGNGYKTGLYGIAWGETKGEVRGVSGFAQGGEIQNGGYFSVNALPNNKRAGGVRGSVFGKGNGYKTGLSGIATGGTKGSRCGVRGITSGGEFQCGGNFVVNADTNTKAAHGVEGTAYADYADENTNELFLYGLYGTARGGTKGRRYGVSGVAFGGETNYGVYGSAGSSGTNYAGYFSGNVRVTGTLTKGKGSFLIDHPLDPLNKTLRHNLVESPEDLCLYRGKVKLNSEGSATVQMPDYFAALTKEEAATVNLTPIGKNPFLVSYEWNQEYTAFAVFGEPNAEVAYLVLADRDDPVIHQLREPVEQEKGNGNFEQGKLLYPEAYGYSQKMGVDYHEDESFPSEITETIELEDLNSQIQD